MCLQEQWPELLVHWEGDPDFDLEIDRYKGLTLPKEIEI